MVYGFVVELEPGSVDSEEQNQQGCLGQMPDLAFHNYSKTLSSVEW